MSRWLENVAIASTDGSPPKQPGPLHVKFNGSMVMLFGESTPDSGKYRVHLDGKLVERKSSDGKQAFQEFDAAEFAKRLSGKAYLVQVLAEGLDPEIPHTLDIEPVLADDLKQELRLESICVAGGKAEVSAAAP